MLAGMASSLAALLIDKHSFYDYLRTEYVHELHHAEEKNKEPTVV
jgi:hypothetical protein